MLWKHRQIAVSQVPSGVLGEGQQYLRSFWSQVYALLVSAAHTRAGLAMKMKMKVISWRASARFVTHFHTPMSPAATLTRIEEEVCLRRNWSAHGETLIPIPAPAQSSTSQDNRLPDVVRSAAGTTHPWSNPLLSPSVTSSSASFNPFRHGRRMLRCNSQIRQRKTSERAVQTLIFPVPWPEY